jgi:hypothetical protein
MKAGKKMAAKRQHRTKQHLTAIQERKRKGFSEPEKGFRFPGSNNLKKQ